MSTDNPIISRVPFHGDTIITVETADELMVAIRPICERIGLDFSSQLKRLKSNPRWRGGLIATPSEGGMQETWCIPLSKLDGWLSSITLNRVKPEVRPTLALYQEEADAVLFRHFRQQQDAKDRVIAELRAQLYFSHLQLRGRMDRWAAFVDLWNAGHIHMNQMCEMLRMRRNKVEDLRDILFQCGMIAWEVDGEKLVPETMAARISDLEWQLRQKEYRVGRVGTAQPDLFEGGLDA